MALQKEIRYLNGAVTNYHRVSDLMKNGDEIQVLVRSYIDEQTREAEEYWLQKKDEYNQAVMQGNEELAEEIRLSVDPKLLNTLLGNGADFSVCTTPIYFSYERDLNYNLTMETVYDALTTTEEFYGAKMV